MYSVALCKGFIILCLGFIETWWYLSPLPSFPYFDTIHLCPPLPPPPWKNVSSISSSSRKKKESSVLPNWTYCILYRFCTMYMCFTCLLRWCLGLLTVPILSVLSQYMHSWNKLFVMTTPQGTGLDLHKCQCSWGPCMYVVCVCVCVRTCVHVCWCACVR